MTLPKPGTPYLDGISKVIEPDDVDDIPDRPTVGVPSLRNMHVKSKRSLQDLPADIHTQSVINAIMVYHLLGMTDNEIAIALNTKIADVQQVKQLPAYQETFEMVFAEAISANSNSLQARIAAFAGEAVDHVMELARAAHTGADAIPAIVKLKANQDILDRSGLAADTLFGKNATGGEEDTLRIVVNSSGDNKTQVNVDFSRRK